MKIAIGSTLAQRLIYLDDLGTYSSEIGDMKECLRYCDLVEIDVLGMGWAGLSPNR